MAQQLYFQDFAREGEDFYMADLVLSKGERTSPHCHDFYEFLVVLEGAFCERCNQSEHREEKRTLHLLAPEDVHWQEGLEGRNVLRNIAVRRSVMETALADCGLRPGDLRRPFLLRENALNGYWEKTALLRPGEARGGQRGIFLGVLYDCLLAALAQGSAADGVPDWLQRAHEQMRREENFLEGLPRLLQLCDRSQEHVTRSFMQYYGISPTAYINDCRLQKAASLLMDGNKSVLDVACESGFQNLSYFNRRFKARFGMTPLQYRHKNRKLFL